MATRGRFAELVDGGFIHAAHLKPLGDYAADPISVARRFIGAPYLWGGRESTGLDCSALVQLALQACGMACPRDSDMQQAALGQNVEQGKKGDVVLEGPCRLFVRGNLLLHANAHHMAVVEEDFEAACARIGESDGPVTAISACRQPLQLSKAAANRVRV